MNMISIIKNAPSWRYSIAAKHQLSSLFYPQSLLTHMERANSEETSLVNVRDSTGIAGIASSTAADHGPDGLWCGYHCHITITSSNHDGWSWKRNLETTLWFPLQIPGWYERSLTPTYAVLLVTEGWKYWWIVTFIVNNLDESHPSYCFVTGGLNGYIRWHRWNASAGAKGALWGESADDGVPGCKSKHVTLTYPMLNKHPRPLAIALSSMYIYLLWVCWMWGYGPLVKPCEFNLSGKPKTEREIQPCNREVCLSELF